MADPYIKRNNIFPSRDLNQAALKPRPPSPLSLGRPDRRLMSPEQKLQWVKSLQERTRSHMRRHEQMWVGRESIRLINNRFKPQLNHPATKICRIGAECS